MPDAHGDETDDERLDRELDQLLQELLRRDARGAGAVRVPARDGVVGPWFVLGSVRRMSNERSRDEEPAT